MDIKTQVDSIVDGLVRDIETRLNTRVDSLVNTFVGNKLEGFDYETKLNWLASVKLDGLISNIEINKSNIEKRLDSVTDVIINNVESECRAVALDHVRTQLFNNLDVRQIVYDIVSNEILRRMETMQFPERSIPATAINPVGLVLSADSIKGGMISNFSSQGIEDKSTQVQMTLMDAGVVVENKLVSLGLEVHGDTTLKGNVSIEGDISEASPFYQRLVQSATTAVHGNLNETLFGNYSNLIFEQIKADGLDLNRITLNGAEIIKGNQLNAGITQTNIQRVGTLVDLQTQGESYLSETLYVGKNKVGVGTIEPAHALSVWDQEVEVGVGKRSRDTAWIGTPRNQDIVLSANNNDNLVLGRDGSVTVQQLNVNKIAIISSPSTPNVDAPRGTVAFNENPAAGQAVGWISLGGGAWSRFGLIG